MYNGRKIVALIPARGGSKGIKNKNIIDLDGRPLISYSIRAGIDSEYIDDVVVSTDSELIASVAVRYGAKVPFMRPAELASDNSKTIDAVLHAVRFWHDNNYDYDALVLLQPTQPLRTAKDIDLAIEKYYQYEQDLVSVTPVENHPLLIRSIDSDGKLVNLLNANSTCRRQDMPEYYCVNGCIYINKISRLSEETSFNDNKIPFIMDPLHSVDIDDMTDLAMAELIIQMQKMKNMN
jgi:CMP-N-acetylneuraminic acid synthetase